MVVAARPAATSWLTPTDDTLPLLFVHLSDPHVRNPGGDPLAGDPLHAAENSSPYHGDGTDTGRG